MASQNISKIPSIYLAEENLKPATSSWIAACQEVRQAFESYGCFVAVYDKISKELSNSIFQVLPELFDLPSKIKSQNISNIPYFGYLPPNRSRPLYESMGIEDATNLQVVQGFTNLMWPSGNQQFWMVFESYGVNKCYDFCNKSNTLFLHRVNKYRVPTLEESTLGVSDHTDLDFITILHQNHVDGLEVKTKDGNWISVHFPPSSFVIMAGEGLRAWSNGRIYSAVHRVIMKGKEERFSTAQMSFPKKIIEAPEEVVTDKHPLQFKPFPNLELLRLYYSEEGKRAEDGLKAWFGNSNLN